MPPFFKWFVLGLLVLIVMSLGVALYHLFRGREAGRDTVKALTVRILLSIGLFVLLMVAAMLGFIRPHGL